MDLENYIPKVLISHSWRDKQNAMAIVDSLRELECANVWIDFEHMNAGVDINHEIYNQISSSDFVILIWTIHSMKSDNVLNEIKWAKKLDKPIIPCLFSYGEDFSVHHKKLERILDHYRMGIEFISHHQGMKELHSTLNAFLQDRLPKEIKEAYADKYEILKRVEGYNKYLVNYRNTKHPEADRNNWIIRIMKEIESLGKMGVSKDIIESFMNHLGYLETSDPEAYKLIKPKLDRYFSPATKGYNYQIPPSVSASFDNPRLENIRNVFIDMVHEERSQSTSFNFIKKSYSQLSDIQIADAIQNIINITGDGLNILNQAYTFSFQAGLSQEFIPILNYVSEYYDHIDDVRSDDLGPWGWVDDSYLSFSSLQQINGVYYSIYQQYLFQVDLNPYIQYLIASLEPSELSQLDKLLRQNFTSIDWTSILIKMAGMSITNILFGNYQINQNNNWRGSWEDQMNERAARLGISLNL